MFTSIFQKFTRNYNLRKFEDCSKNLSVSIKFDIPDNNYNNVIWMAGNMEIKEKLFGPIDLSFDHNRCSLNMTNCEKGGVVNIRELCKKMTDKSYIFANVIGRISPRLSCPVMPGNYTLMKTDLNMKLFSFAPLDGFIFLTIAKAVATDPEKKTRFIVWCNKIETKIVKVRVLSPTT